MTSDNIGDALLARRKQRRLDQGRAASEIGVSPSTYRSYEKNTQRPSVNVFPALSKFLGLEIEDFLPLYAATVIFAGTAAVWVLRNASNIKAVHSGAL
jgi:transcriptional regulator with XRE-family HTH domain